MTRARRSWICVDCMRLAQSSPGPAQCGRLSCGAGGRGERQGTGDWILLPLLYAGGSGAAAVGGHGAGSRRSHGGWQVRLWENPVFECGSAAAAPEEAAVQERTV